MNVNNIEDFKLNSPTKNAFTVLHVQFVANFQQYLIIFIVTNENQNGFKIRRNEFSLKQLLTEIIVAKGNLNGRG